MRHAANLSGLRSHRSWLTVLAFVVALAASIALYLSLSARPAHALDCGYEQMFIRNDAGQHKAQRIPIYTQDCTEVGFFLDHFAGPGGNPVVDNWIHESIHLKNAAKDTLYQQYVDVRFPTASGQCPDTADPPVFAQAGLQLLTDQNGNADAILKVPAPPNGPVPPNVPGQYLCYTYRFVPIDPSGGEVLETPQTLAYIDTPGGPQGGPKFE